jgi:hypothetical protein
MLWCDMILNEIDEYVISSVRSVPKAKRYREGIQCGSRARTVAATAAYTFRVPPVFSNSQAKSNVSAPAAET